MKSNATKSVQRQKESVQKLVFASLFAGLSVALKPFEFYFSNDLRFNLIEVPIIMSGIALGPFWGAAVGGVADIINYLIKPAGAFNVGFTISLALCGALPGVMYSFMRKQKGKSQRAASIAVFIAVFAAAFFYMGRSGFFTIQDGTLYLRSNPVSWVIVAVLAAIVAGSGIALATFYRRYDSPEVLIKPHKVLFCVAAAEICTSLILNSLLLYYMYGPGTAVTFPIRVLKVAVAIPVFTTICVALLNAIAKRKLIRF